LTGDLQSATTQYWNGSAWTGSDTYYYRYYTGPTCNAAGQFIGFAHGLKREIMPASYSSLASAVDPGGTPAQQLAAVSQLPDDDANTNPNCEIGKYTCFYYQYDVDRRVTLETVFGKLRTETYAYTEGSDDVQNADSSYNLDVWTTKTVETMADGSTYTVYSNYLGQTLLDDLCDVTTGQHTYTYYEYDSYGNITLQAPSSAITGYNDGDGTQVGTISGSFGDDFRIHLGLPATAASPVTEYAYTVSVRDKHG
jgi:hypothetical protein